jgi:hypothetical protein
MNRDQKLLEEAYESIYNDFLTSFEVSLVKKAAQDITALYFQTKRTLRPLTRIALFKDFLDLKQATEILSSRDDIEDFLYEKLTNSLWNITFDENSFRYRVSSLAQTLTGTEENLEEFLYKVFSDAILSFINTLKKTNYSGLRSDFVDYIKTKRELQKKVDKELHKDFDIDLRDF